MVRKDNAQRLVKHLLCLSGKHVVSLNARRGLAKVRSDPHIDSIWERGLHIDYRIATEILPNAKPNRCHHLAARHYADQPRIPLDSIVLLTGYALSADEIWRSHSWTMLRSFTRIFEPTPEKRLRYFGVLLGAEEADKFVESNG